MVQQQIWNMGMFMIFDQGVRMNVWLMRTVELSQMEQSRIFFSET